MGPDTNPIDDPADAAALRRYADDLLAAVTAALPGWVERVVRERYEAWAGADVPPSVVVEARAAAEAARAEVASQLADLLATDVGAQRSNPLSILRRAARHPTGVLVAAGVPPVVRDAQAERLFPDDHYDLGPAAFADLHPSVHEPGLVWGAAKAYVLLQRL